MLRIIVAIVGLGSSVFAGVLAMPHIGLPNAMLFMLFLGYLFALSFGANLALTAILRPPFKPWHAVMPALFCFAPMYLGYFPASNWLFNLGFTVGWNNVPSCTWLLFVMMLGLLGPAGVFYEGLRTAIGNFSRKASA